MISRRIVVVLLAAVFAGSLPPDAQAQSKPVITPSSDIDISGYAMLGLMNFTAADTFDVGLGSPYGTTFGGGVRVGLPLGGLFVDAGASQFRDRGERAFVFGNQVFHLGIPLDVVITPLALSAGWEFRLRRMPGIRPYVAGGFTSYSYKETSEFATDAENVDERFNGYHVTGGAEFRVERWLGVAWEIDWTRVPNAIGNGGLSELFNESDLGGTSFRFKITIGQ